MTSTTNYMLLADDTCWCQLSLSYWCEVPMMLKWSISYKTNSIRGWLVYQKCRVHCRKCAQHAQTCRIVFALWSNKPRCRTFGGEYPTSTSKAVCTLAREPKASLSNQGEVACCWRYVSKSWILEFFSCLEGPGHLGEWDLREITLCYLKYTPKLRGYLMWDYLP